MRALFSNITKLNKVYVTHPHTHPQDKHHFKSRSLYETRHDQDIYFYTVKLFIGIKKLTISFSVLPECYNFLVQNRALNWHLVFIHSFPHWKKVEL